MTTNEKILEQWSKQIAQIPKLEFKEAQVLTVQMNTTSNETERAEIREKLINGTLYLVCKEIKKYLITINGSHFDIEDIINEANNQWISIIDSSRILSANFFQELFDSVFYSNLCNNLVPEKFPIHEYLNLSSINISILLEAFIEQKNHNEDLSISEFSEYLLVNSQYEKYYWKLTAEENIKMFYNLFYLFNAIYKSLSKNKEGQVEKICQKKLYLSLYLFIDSAHYNYSPSIKDMIYEDPTSKIDQEILDEHLFELIKKLNLPEFKKKIFIRNLGLDGEDPITLEKIAHNCKKDTRQTIHRFKQSVARILRKNPEIRDLHHK